MRHFGCPFCREQVSRLKEDYAKIVTANADVVCIGQGPYKAGKAFSIYFNLPFSVLVCGDDLSVYRNYGLDKGTPNQLFGINVLLRSLAVFKFGVGKVDGDPKQMPGAFIVDPTGKVLYVHRAKNQADYISTQDILKALDKTNR
jgi:peroxiredoxin